MYYIIFLLLLLIKNMAFAQGEVKFLDIVVNEGSSGYATVVFVDNKKQLVKPEAVWYQIFSGSTPTGRMFTCGVVPDNPPLACLQNSDCSVGNCDQGRPYECSRQYCPHRYFFRNIILSTNSRCELGTPSPPTSCDADGNCTNNDACTGKVCQCIGKPAATMDLTLTVRANRFFSEENKFGRERRRIIVWFTFPDGCSDTQCAHGSGEAEYEVQNIYGLCTNTSTTVDGDVALCP